MCDASWPEILTHLSRASIGVNGMWNEHFGIGVVEYQAAGLISVVHNSGGPKKDIVIPGTGFLAENTEGFAEGFAKVLGMEEEGKWECRRRARESSLRFTEEVFAGKWVGQMERLVEMERRVGV